MEGKIVKIISNLYTVSSDNKLYECRARGKIRFDKLTPLVGDKVIFDEKDKYILEILPRKNSLDRPMISNVDSALIITSVKKPDLSLVTLSNNIEPIIVFTKLDLLKKQEMKYIKSIMNYYRKIGIKVCTNNGLFRLKRYIKNKTLVLTGQTGAGKSTLLNKLNKKLNLATNEISEALGRGKHTTRHVELFNYKSSFIADTPGFSSLDLKNIIGKEVKFDYPKPVEFISLLLKISSEKDSIILDFFAGSGTTAQAVLELNKEDDGSRQFILCTNNENNICEDITYQRIKTVITGIRKDNTKYSKGINENLKYYKTSYVPRINTEEENLHNNLLKNIKNLIQLDNGIDIDNKKIKLFIDEEEFDKFTADVEQLNECDKLYVSSDILMTLKQEKIMDNNNIEVYVIPEYYFKDEIVEVTE